MEFSAMCTFQLDNTKRLMYRGLSLTDATPTYLVHTTSDNGFFKAAKLTLSSTVPV